MKLRQEDIIALCINSTITIILACFFFATVKYRIADNERKEKTKIIGAYADVLHRIWIDNPSYIEDVLCETDEFVHLDSLVEGDFEDTFLFWNDKEKIMYKQNQHEKNL